MSDEKKTCPILSVASIIAVPNVLGMNLPGDRKEALLKSLNEDAFCRKEKCAIWIGRGKGYCGLRT